MFQALQVAGAPAGNGGLGLAEEGDPGMGACGRSRRATPARSAPPRMRQGAIEEHPEDEAPGHHNGPDPQKTAGQSRNDDSGSHGAPATPRSGRLLSVDGAHVLHLFIATSYITADAAEYFGLPHDRTVIMGSHIEV
ncbi:hypothetical protein [Streptomyces sp. NPDC004546]|uniref:hypothetical protein n=1 Tax=Streptomyces sp. NPDC004546 TaxID=3154282 RepID=UPI0033AD1151